MKASPKEFAVFVHDTATLVIHIPYALGIGMRPQNHRASESLNVQDLIRPSVLTKIESQMSPPSLTSVHLLGLLSPQRPISVDRVTPILIPEVRRILA